MKGVELIASLIAFFVMFGITAFLGGLAISVINVGNMANNPRTYQMFLSPVYPPVKYEDMLLSYLESTTQTTDGTPFQIKRVLTYAAYQENVTYININNKIITSLKSTSSKIFFQWLKDQGYLLVLNIKGKPYVLAKNGFLFSPESATYLRRISIPTYIDSESFYKTDNGLPLNVTLDLYVR